MVIFFSSFILSIITAIPCGISSCKNNNAFSLIISEDISYDYLAQKTDGYTQAEIENIVVKALELATRRMKESDITPINYFFYFKRAWRCAKY